MIKVGIVGAESSMSGELIRILAMHPDVEIVAAQARGLEGRFLSEIHHGLIGETEMQFTASVDFTRCDLLFVVGSSLGPAELAQLRLSRPELKIILMEQDAAPEIEGEEVVYGLPEINRKQLVRGATTAIVPQAFASMALVALYPFAMNLLLNGDIEIEAAAPAKIIAATDMNRVRDEIEGMLRETQRSFEGKVNITTKPSIARRSTLMDIRFKCPVNLTQILGLYDCYDDHRFSFVTTVPVGVSEVAGTNKCVISVSKEAEGNVVLSVAADCRLRGGAGEAVHIMNLMFGLHEKTGLHLKAIDFHPVNDN